MNGFAITSYLSTGGYVSLCTGSLKACWCSVAQPMASAYFCCVLSSLWSAQKETILMFLQWWHTYKQNSIILEGTDQLFRADLFQDPSRCLYHFPHGPGRSQIYGRTHTLSL